MFSIILSSFLSVVVGISFSGMKAETAKYYQKCIQDAGAELVIFDHYAQDEVDAAELVSKVDAVIIPGKTKKDIKNRNTFDKRIIAAAVEANKPMLGICKGHQCINSFFGGKTVKNKEYYPNSQIVHKKLEKKPDGTSFNVTLNSECHNMKINKKSTLYQILGKKKKIKVNSSHDWCVYKLGEGVKLVATADDGICEAIEGKNFLGVQFHPEYLYGKMDIKPFLGIFKWLVDTAEANKASK